MKSAFISIIGPSNAGKSTLINTIIGKKVSIVTHKVQTTRSILRAVLTVDKTQLVFMDTPGIFLPKFFLEKKLVGSAWKSVRGVDYALIVIDATHGVTPNVENILTKIKTKTVVAINKIDLIEKSQLMNIALKIQSISDAFEKIFMISALKNDGVEELKNYLLNIAPEGQWFFDKDITTDAPIDFMLSEITREKLFLRIHQEIPYSLMVETEGTKEENGIVSVNQVIYVINNSHKKIIIGEGGNVIKHIRKNAMKEMMKLLEKRVRLYLFIKVKPNWQDNKQIMSNIAYME